MTANQDEIDPEEVAQVLTGVKPVCVNCKWLDMENHVPGFAGSHYCRRYPEAQRTEKYDWCGEFKIRPANWTDLVAFEYE